MSYSEETDIFSGGSFYRQWVEFLTPFIEPIVRRRLKEEKTLSWRLQSFFETLVLRGGCILVWITDKEFRDYWQTTRIDRRAGRKETNRKDQEDRADIVSTAREFVRIWALSLIFFARKNGKGQLEISALDEAMVPPMALIGGISVYEQVSFSTILTADDAREILLAVKASLPAGQFLPVIMMEYLQRNGIRMVA